MKKQNRAVKNCKPLTAWPQPGPRRQWPPLVIDSPATVFTLWRNAVPHLDWYDEKKEHLVCLPLDTKRRLAGFAHVSTGTLNESLAGAREIFRAAIATAAHSIVVAHYHPSGDPSPSAADMRLTKRIFDAGELVGIPLLDHVIIGDGKFHSLKSSSKDWPPQESVSEPAPATPISHYASHILLRREQERRRNNQRRGRKLSEIELILLCDLYDKMEDKPFADAMSWAHGLAELLAENNAPEVRSLKRMVEAGSELNKIRTRVRSI